MIDFLRVKLHCAGLILKDKDRSGAIGVFDLLRGYVKIVLVYIFWVRLFGSRPVKERILGLTFNFFSYVVFINLFEEIFIYKTYFFRSASKKPVIIDCGSNIGMSVLYFKKLYPGARITAFEADWDSFGLLERNIRDNNLGDVKTINRALYGVKGRAMKFYVNRSDRGNPVNGLIKRREEFSFSGKYEIRTETLSGYISGRVDFLKMDIEGAEYQVLAELSKKRKLRHINESVIEYHHHIDPETDKLGDILNMFENAGFGYQISTWTRPPFLKKRFQDLNIYFYSKSRN